MDNKGEGFNDGEQFHSTGRAHQTMQDVHCAMYNYYAQYMCWISQKTMVQGASTDSLWQKRESEHRNWGSFTPIRNYSKLGTETTVIVPYLIFCSNHQPSRIDVGTAMCGKSD